MSCNLQSRVTHRIERCYCHIKIQQIGVIAIDHIECTIIEVCTIFLARHTNSIAPCPLTVNHSVVPAVLTQWMVLCIQILRIISFPPFSFSVCLGQFSIVWNSFLRTFRVMTLRRLIPAPRMVGMQADSKIQSVFSCRFLPSGQNIFLRGTVWLVRQW